MQCPELENMSNGLFGWYPIKEKSQILCFGKSKGASYLASKCNQIDILCSSDNEVMFCNNSFANFDNIKVINEDIAEYSICSEVKYDYIFYNFYDIYQFPVGVDEYYNLIKAMKKLLSDKGVILLCVPNRFGAKYLCGAPDLLNGEPFYGIYETSSCRLDFDELKLISSKCGFKNIHFHYPFPDVLNPECVFSDKYPVGSKLFEKTGVITTEIGSKVLNEDLFMRSVARNNNSAFFSNSIIAEISNTDCGDIVYSSITANRKKENAFFTNVHESGVVSKIPLYKNGVNHLNALKSALDELADRGISVLKIKVENSIGIMPRVYYPTLSDHLREVIRYGKEDIIPYLKKLYDIIIRSSDESDEISERFSVIPLELISGPVLKRCFFEIIPVNIFYNDGEYILFDQECVLENAPASFIIFRCIHDLIIHIHEFTVNYDVEAIKKYFEVNELWDYYLKIESEILRNDYFSDQFNEFTDNAICYYGYDNHVITQNRMCLKMNIEVCDRVFDPFDNLNNKKIILFGSGKFADYYFEKFGDLYPPAFIVDNSPNKQGTLKKGVRINSPEVLYSLKRDSFRIVIAVADSKPIIDQLESMGFDHNNYRLFNRRVSELLPYRINKSISGEKYDIGYIPGAFDLFHIGHLNILRRCKEKCHYLIAGILNDDIIRTEKFKEPIIPFEERMEIVKQCKYVDRVVEVDRRITDKLDAWKELRYDCLFSGTDHVEHYAELQKQLRSLGSELIFFPYTQGTSSTKLAELINSKLEK